MPNYCKKCGYVFGDGRVPKLVQKGMCPTCKSRLFETKEPISYFQGRIEKSMPTWEDVVRNKYLKNIQVDSNLSNINKNNEQEHYQHELNKLNGNNIETHTSKPTKPTITCPYCQSTNTKRISGLSKAGSVALFGIFALGKTTKQWHCNECGSDF